MTMSGEGECRETSPLLVDPKRENVVLSSNAASGPPRSVHGDASLPVIQVEVDNQPYAQNPVEDGRAKLEHSTR